MKKSLKFIIPILVIALCFGAFVYASSSAKITISQVETTIDDTVDVYVSLSNSSALKGGGISDITYDNTALRLDNAELVLSSTPILQDCKADGEAVFAYSEVTNCNGNLLKLTFTALKKSGTFPISCKVTLRVVNDGVEESVTPTIIDGSVKINKKDFVGLTFSNVEYQYNGNQHKIEVNGDFPVGTSVVYESLTANENKATDAGTYSIKATVSCDYYNDLVLNADMKITPKPLTVSGLAASNKEYNGNNLASLSGGELVGIVNSDDVSATMPTSGTFVSKNAGENIAVNVAEIELVGSKKDNYTLTQPTGITANITKKALKIKVANINIVYGDVMPEPEITYTGFVSGEDKSVLTTPVIVNGIPAVADVDEYDLTLSGATSNNYEISYEGAKLVVTPKTLTISGLTAINKVYDGNTNADLTGGTLEGIVGSDDVSATMPTSGTFASADVSNDIAVSIATINLEGAKAGNYTLTQPTGLKANIAPKELTVTGLAATNKIYDGNTDADLTGGTLVGIVNSDDVSATMPMSGTFASANVANDIAVSISNISLEGTKAGNYTLTQPTGLKANITPKTLTVSSLIAINKIYDGNTNADLTGGTLEGVVGSDDVSATMPTTGTFASADVANDIAVSVANINLEGTKAGNYTLTQPTELKANITPKELTVTGLAATNKIYDGNTSATLSGGTLEGIVGSDDVSATMPTEGTFASADVANDIAVSVANINLEGTKTGNYTLTQPTGLKANITKAPLTIKIDNISITYGDVMPESVITYAGFVMGEDKTALITPVVVNGIPAEVNAGEYDLTLSNATSNNYEITYENAKLNVDKKTITVIGIIINDKIADGTNAATIDGTQTTFTGNVDGDNVSVDTSSSTAEFAEVTVGESIAVIVSNILLSGDDKNNYELASNTFNTTGNIKANIVVIAGENGTATGSGVFAKDTDVTVVATPDSGYRFSGWYNGETSVSTSATYTFKAVENIELAAKFSKITYSSGGGGGGGGVSSYTIKFDTDGGSTVKSQSVNKNKTVTEPTVPTKDGYTFDGWYTDKDLTEKYDFESKVTKSFTLYAKWVENKTEEQPDETDKPETPDAQAMPFTDVDANDWYYETVKTAYEKGLMKGISDTEFGADTNVTRGMFVTVLYRMENEPVVNRSIPFADVNATDYYSNAVIWAQQNNIVSGVTDTEFAPNNSITREQMATILFRYATYKGMDTATLAENLGQFTDNAKISEYAISALNWAVCSNVMSGKGNGILDPKGFATRAEAAAVLVRMAK